MNLVFIRHAHRDTSKRAEDNGLSSKGKEQAKLLARFSKKRLDALDSKDLKKVFIYSSPKKRCIETVEGIAKELSVKIIIDPDLDEQSADEGSGDLKRRCKAFLARIKKMHSQSNEWVLCSSHGDWLPVALLEYTGCSVDLKKSAWAHTENAALVSLLQPEDLKQI
jgi:broad specificity phosphatase PhoE